MESALTGAGETGVGECIVPELTESVSEKDGIITITINNLSLSHDEELTIRFEEDREFSIEEAAILNSADVHDRNTFEAPDTVKERKFEGASANGRTISLVVPRASVILLRVK